jgi:hypothetical protein
MDPAPPPLKGVVVPGRGKIVVVCGKTPDHNVALVNTMITHWEECRPLGSKHTHKIVFSSDPEKFSRISWKLNSLDKLQHVCEMATKNKSVQHCIVVDEIIRTRPTEFQKHPFVSAVSSPNCCFIVVGQAPNMIPSHLRTFVTHFIMDPTGMAQSTTQMAYDIYGTSQTGHRQEWLSLMASSHNNDDGDGPWVILDGDCPAKLYMFDSDNPVTCVGGDADDFESWVASTTAPSAVVPAGPVVAATSHHIQKIEDDVNYLRDKFANEFERSVVRLRILEVKTDAIVRENARLRVLEAKTDAVVTENDRLRSDVNTLQDQNQFLSACVEKLEQECQESKKSNHDHAKMIENIQIELLATEAINEQLMKTLEKKCRNYLDSRMDTHIRGSVEKQRHTQGDDQSAKKSTTEDDIIVVDDYSDEEQQQTEAWV